MEATGLEGTRSVRATSRSAKGERRLMQERHIEAVWVEGLLEWESESPSTKYAPTAHKSASHHHKNLLGQTLSTEVSAMWNMHGDLDDFEVLLALQISLA